VEEFYPDATSDLGPDVQYPLVVTRATNTMQPTLREKLDMKAADSKPGELP